MSSATSPSLLVKTQFEIHELEKNQLGNVPYFLSALSKKSSEGGSKIEQDRAKQGNNRMRFTSYIMIVSE